MDDYTNTLLARLDALYPECPTFWGADQEGRPALTVTLVSEGSSAPMGTIHMRGTTHAECVLRAIQRYSEPFVQSCLFGRQGRGIEDEDQGSHGCLDGRGGEV